MTATAPTNPCAKWDDVIAPLKAGKGKWHPESVPTLRGKQKKPVSGIPFAANKLVDLCNRLAGLARKRVLGGADIDFPNHEFMCAPS